MRFGIVEMDDGGPTIILGSEPSSDEDDEEVESKEAAAEKEREQEREEEERRKHHEFELRRKMEERVKLEEEEVAKLDAAAERKRQEEEDRMKLEEKERQKREEEVQRKRTDEGLLSFEHNASSPAEKSSLMNVDFDDFSVKKSIMDSVEFDDFSVKSSQWGLRAPAVPRRSGPGAEEELVQVVERVRVEPVQQAQNQDRGAKEEPTWRVERRKPPVDLKNLQDMKDVMDYGANGRTDEELEQTVCGEMEVDKEVEKTVEEKKKESDTLSINDMLKDQTETDTSETEVTPEQLEQEEPEEAEVHEQKENSSPAPTDSEELVFEPPAEFSIDSDFPEESNEPVPFPESTPLLDSSVQRSKVDLGRRRSKARTPHSLRIKPKDSQDWRICDSTDGPAPVNPEQDQDPEEQSPKQVLPSAPQRVRVFPGVNPASLIAQMKKRTSDRASEQEQQLSHSREVHSVSNSTHTTPSTGSTHSAPSAGGPSPTWLQELKSKQRKGQT